MTTLNNTKNLSAFNGSGVESPPAATGLVTLTATDDFYFEIPFSADADVQSIHIMTGALIAGVFTIETCNFPVGTAADCVTGWDETSGNWVQENPSDAYIPTVGTGWTVSAATLTKTAGAGGAMITIDGLAAKRVRIKAAITTSGTVRVTAHGKA